MADFFRKLFGYRPLVNNKVELPTHEATIHTGRPKTLNYVMKLNYIAPLFFYDQAHDYHIPVRLVPEINQHNTVTSIRVFMDTDPLNLLDQYFTTIENLTFERAYATHVLNGTFAIQMVNSDQQTIYLQQQHSIEIDA